MMSENSGRDYERDIIGVGELCVHNIINFVPIQVNIVSSLDRLCANSYLTNRE